ncbi:pyridoxal phosphate-dependent aminotransferase [Halobacteriales archaeon QS_1_68_20]|nr:MAG: pyridoxal phosphate-dependent aminotransferase [Halobacteriales archaeon QS_1_68_20]
MARRIEHLAWLDGRKEAASHDLATSDLVAAAGEAGLVPGSLTDRSDPPPDRTLEAQLATVYGVTPDSVLVTAGATQANLLAVAAATDEGDRVLVESPGYEPLRATPSWLGRGVDTFPRPVEAEYALASERILAETRPETGLVVVTNRHNPSGRLVNRDTLAVAGVVAGDADARLLVDEVYAPYGVAPRDGAFGGPTAAGMENAVVTSSLTKVFGLGGLRIGWIVADPDFVSRARDAMTHTPFVATPSRELARRALFHRDDLLTRSREVIRENGDLLRTFVAGRPDLSGPVFDGATFAFLEHERADGDELVDAALEADVLLTPGRFFEAPGGVRVSLGHDPAEMQAALDAFGDVLDGL